jgi:hypothetical protein
MLLWNTPLLLSAGAHHTGVLHALRSAHHHHRRQLLKTGSITLAALELQI